MSDAILFHNSLWLPCLLLSSSTSTGFLESNNLDDNFAEEVSKKLIDTCLSDKYKKDQEEFLDNNKILENFKKSVISLYSEKYADQFKIEDDFVGSEKKISFILSIIKVCLLYSAEGKGIINFQDCIKDTSQCSQSFIQNCYHYGKSHDLGMTEVNEEIMSHVANALDKLTNVQQEKCSNASEFIRLLSNVLLQVSEVKFSFASHTLLSSKKRGFRLDNVIALSSNSNDVHGLKLALNIIQLLSDMIVSEDNYSIRENIVTPSAILNVMKNSIENRLKYLTPLDFDNDIESSLISMNKECKDIALISAPMSGIVSFVSSWIMQKYGINSISKKECDDLCVVVQECKSLHNNHYFVKESHLVGERISSVISDVTNELSELFSNSNNELISNINDIYIYSLLEVCNIDCSTVSLKQIRQLLYCIKESSCKHTARILNSALNRVIHQVVLQVKEELLSSAKGLSDSVFEEISIKIDQDFTRFNNIDNLRDVIAYTEIIRQEIKERSEKEILQKDIKNLTQMLLNNSLFKGKYYQDSVSKKYELLYIQFSAVDVVCDIDKLPDSLLKSCIENIRSIRKLLLSMGEDVVHQVDGVIKIRIDVLQECKIKVCYKDLINKLIYHLEEIQSFLNQLYKKNVLKYKNELSLLQETDVLIKNILNDKDGINIVQEIAEYLSVDTSILEEEIKKLSDVERIFRLLSEKTKKEKKINNVLNLYILCYPRSILGKLLRFRDSYYNLFHHIGGFSEVMEALADCQKESHNDDMVSQDNMASQKLCDVISEIYSDFQNELQDITDKYPESIAFIHNIVNVVSVNDINWTSLWSLLSIYHDVRSLYNVFIKIFSSDYYQYLDKDSEKVMSNIDIKSIPKIIEDFTEYKKIHNAIQSSDKTILHTALQDMEDMCRKVKVRNVLTASYLQDIKKLAKGVTSINNVSDCGISIKIAPSSSEKKIRYITVSLMEYIKVLNEIVCLLNNMSPMLQGIMLTLPIKNMICLGKSYFSFRSSELITKIGIMENTLFYVMHYLYNLENVSFISDKKRITYSKDSRCFIIHEECIIDTKQETQDLCTIINNNLCCAVEDDRTVNYVRSLNEKYHQMCFASLTDVEVENYILWNDMIKGILRCREVSANISSAFIKFLRKIHASTADKNTAVEALLLTIDCSKCIEFKVFCMKEGHNDRNLVVEDVIKKKFMSMMYYEQVKNFCNDILSIFRNRKLLQDLREKIVILKDLNDDACDIKKVLLNDLDSYINGERLISDDLIKDIVSRCNNFIDDESIYIVSQNIIRDITKFFPMVSNKIRKIHYLSICAKAFILEEGTQSGCQLFHLCTQDIISIINGLLDSGALCGNNAGKSERLYIHCLSSNEDTLSIHLEYRLVLHDIQKNGDCIYSIVPCLLDKEGKVINILSTSNNKNSIIPIAQVHCIFDQDKGECTVNVMSKSDAMQSISMDKVLRNSNSSNCADYNIYTVLECNNEEFVGNIVYLDSFKRRVKSSVKSNKEIIAAPVESSDHLDHILSSKLIKITREIFHPDISVIPEEIMDNSDNDRLRRGILRVSDWSYMKRSDFPSDLCSVVLCTYQDGRLEFAANNTVTNTEEQNAQYMLATVSVLMKGENDTSVLERVVVLYNKAQVKDDIALIYNDRCQLLSIGNDGKLHYINVANYPVVLPQEQCSLWTMLSKNVDIEFSPSSERKYPAAKSVVTILNKEESAITVERSQNNIDEKDKKVENSLYPQNDEVIEKLQLLVRKLQDVASEHVLSSYNSIISKIESAIKNDNLFHNIKEFPECSIEKIITSLTNSRCAILKDVNSYNNEVNLVIKMLIKSYCLVSSTRLYVMNLPSDYQKHSFFLAPRIIYYINAEGKLLLKARLSLFNKNTKQYISDVIMDYKQENVMLPHTSQDISDNKDYDSSTNMSRRNNKSAMSLYDLNIQGNKILEYDSNIFISDTSRDKVGVYTEESEEDYDISLPKNILNSLKYNEIICNNIIEYINNTHDTFIPEEFLDLCADNEQDDDLSELEKFLRSINDNGSIKMQGISCKLRNVLLSAVDHQSYSKAISSVKGYLLSYLKTDESQEDIVDFCQRTGFEYFSVEGKELNDTQDLELHFTPIVHIHNQSSVKLSIVCNICNKDGEVLGIINYPKTSSAKLHPDIISFCREKNIILSSCASEHNITKGVIKTCSIGIYRKLSIKYDNKACILPMNGNIHSLRELSAKIIEDRKKELEYDMTADDLYDAVSVVRSSEEERDKNINVLYDTSARVDNKLSTVLSTSEIKLITEFKDAEQLMRIAVLNRIQKEVKSFGDSMIKDRNCPSINRFDSTRSLENIVISGKQYTESRKSFFVVDTFIAKIIELSACNNNDYSIIRCMMHNNNCELVDEEYIALSTASNVGDILGLIIDEEGKEILSGQYIWNIMQGCTDKNSVLEEIRKVCSNEEKKQASRIDFTKLLHVKGGKVYLKHSNCVNMVKVEGELDNSCIMGHCYNIASSIVLSDDHSEIMKSVFRRGNSVSDVLQVFSGKLSEYPVPELGDNVKVKLHANSSCQLLPRDTISSKKMYFSVSLSYIKSKTFSEQTDLFLDEAKKLLAQFNLLQDTQKALCLNSLSISYTSEEVLLEELRQKLISKVVEDLSCRASVQESVEVMGERVIVDDCDKNSYCDDKVSQDMWADIKNIHAANVLNGTFFSKEDYIDDYQDYMKRYSSLFSDIIYNVSNNTALRVVVVPVADNSVIPSMQDLIVAPQCIIDVQNGKLTRNYRTVICNTRTGEIVGKLGILNATDNALCIVENDVQEMLWIKQRDCLDKLVHCNTVKDLELLSDCSRQGMFIAKSEIMSEVENFLFTQSLLNERCNTAENVVMAAFDIVNDKKDNDNYNVLLQKIAHCQHTPAQSEDMIVQESQSKSDDTVNKEQQKEKDDSSLYTTQHNNARRRDLKLDLKENNKIQGISTRSDVPNINMDNASCGSNIKPCRFSTTEKIVLGSGGGSGIAATVVGLTGIGISVTVLHMMIVAIILSVALCVSGIGICIVTIAGGVYRNSKLNGIDHNEDAFPVLENKDMKDMDITTT